MDAEKDPPAQEDFIDFELEIGPGSGRSYPVAVVRSAAGEARGIMQFPLDDLELENQLLTLQNALLRSGGKPRHIMLPEEQSVQDFGLTLFNTLFMGAIGNCYAVSRREAERQGKGLRVKLRILSPEMAALPWEFIYDPSRAEYICLSRNTPVVRYIELPQPPQPLPVTLPLRILGMITTPSNLPPLDVKREQERMEKALEPLQQRGLVQLTWLAGQTWRDVQQAMREGPWHIFHFIGHGSFDPLTDEGQIAFADEQGQADLFRATQLGRLLADHRSLRLVVLNACESAKGGRHDVFSSAAANLVRHGIPAVLAMQYTITDAAAIVFSRAFYEALAGGMPIDAAVSEARKAVSFDVENTLEWGIPVLFMRSPDGVLFSVSQEPTPTLRQPPGPLTFPQEAPAPAMRQPPSQPPVEAPPIMGGPQPRPQPAHRRVSRGQLILLIALVGIVIVGSVGVFNWFRNLGSFSPPRTDPYTGRGKLALEDPLVDNRQGYTWLEGTNKNGATCQFTAQGYRVTQPQSGYFHACMAQATDYSNFVFEVQVTMYSGDYIGMIFRNTSSTTSHYLFRVDPKGQYYFKVYTHPNDYGEILHQGNITPINFGQAYQLAVVANFGNIDLYVDQQKIASITDGTLTHGQIGVLVGNEVNQAVALFRNAKVWVI
jgi:hypothetical protein